MQAPHAGDGVTVVRWVWLMLTSGVLMGALGFISPLVHGKEIPPQAAVTVLPEVLADGQVALRVRWHWKSHPSPLRRWPLLAWVGCTCLQVDPDDLLAVSFDTRHWAYEGDDAPMGRGADGLPLRRLEAVRGPDPGRRLYFVSPGRDGRLTIWFRPAVPGARPDGRFLVDYVHDYGWEGWVLTAVAEVPPSDQHRGSVRT